VRGETLVLIKGDDAAIGGERGPADGAPVVVEGLVHVAHVGVVDVLELNVPLKVFPKIEHVRLASSVRQQVSETPKERYEVDAKVAMRVVDKRRQYGARADDVERPLLDHGPTRVGELGWRAARVRFRYLQLRWGGQHTIKTTAHRESKCMGALDRTHDLVALTAVSLHACTDKQLTRVRTFLMMPNFATLSMKSLMEERERLV
jgi:hypothetical protein